MNTPPVNDLECYEACSRRDSQYDGIFVMAVRTTGIFCRPSCPARTPNRENVRFFTRPDQALSAGYRPCLRCRPLDLAGHPPRWLRELQAQLDQRGSTRVTDRDLRELGVEPKRVRRWFQQHYGITFQRYRRGRQLAEALARLSRGDDPLAVALDSGYESLSGFREAFQKQFGGLSPGKPPTDEAPLWMDRYLSPLGPMLMIADDQALFLLEFADRFNLPDQLDRLQQLTGRAVAPGHSPLHDQTARELDAYFHSPHQSPFTVPLAIRGTPFQQDVWEALREIPVGETRSYGQLAARLGRPGSQRAIGRTNGDNRLAIVVPCHRVVRADGSLSGYAGGTCRKRWLIQLEAER